MKVKVVEGVWGNCVVLDYRRAKRPSNTEFALCVALDLVSLATAAFAVWFWAASQA